MLASSENSKGFMILLPTWSRHENNKEINDLLNLTQLLKKFNNFLSRKREMIIGITNV